MDAWPTPVFVNAGERLETVHATDGGPHGRPIFYDEQALLATGVEMLGVAHFGVLDDAMGLEGIIFGITVVLSTFGLREHRISTIWDWRVYHLRSKEVKAS